MRQFVYLVLFLALVSCGEETNVQVGNKTSMEIDPLFDAGEVIKGEVVTAKFKVKNTGDYPLILAEVKGSCSCTVAEYPEDPLQPGSSAVILAHVKTAETGTGVINKSVSIVANTEPSVTKVMIRAKVKSK